MPADKALREAADATEKLVRQFVMLFGGKGRDEQTIIRSLDRLRAALAATEEPATLRTRGVNAYEPDEPDIEATLAQPAPALDVERLTVVLLKQRWYADEADASIAASSIAAEYARLAASQSVTEEPDEPLR